VTNHYKEARHDRLVYKSSFVGIVWVFVTGKQKKWNKGTSDLNEKSLLKKDPKENRRLHSRGGLDSIGPLISPIYC